MKFNTLTATAALLLGSAGAMAGTPIGLTEVTPGNWAGTFQGAASSQTFDLDLTGFSPATIVTSLLTANSVLGQGYDITGATFDGSGFTPVINIATPFATVDYWTYGPVTVAQIMHHLVVSGASLAGGAFTGSIAVSISPISPPPVPEPETYALMLAGLGAIGFLARRRQQR